MMKTKKTSASLLPCMVLAAILCAASLPFSGITALADAADYDMPPSSTPVDYDVKVDAPDGGVNLRYGPSTDHVVLVSMIPNGTILHVSSEAKASNGRKWGLTDYDGSYGWISLTQVKKVEAAPSKAPLSTEDYVGGASSDYQVQVSAPDGGLNLRYGPGTGYAIKRSMIPNSVILDISSEVKDPNGKYWGYTSYDGIYGWVALSQTNAVSPDPAAEIGVPATAPPVTGFAEPVSQDVSEGLVDDSFPEASAIAATSAPQTESPTPSEVLPAQPAGSGTLLIQVLAAACVALAVAVVAVLVILIRNKKQQP